MTATAAARGLVLIQVAERALVADVFGAQQKRVALRTPGCEAERDRDAQLGRGQALEVLRAQPLVGTRAYPGLDDLGHGQVVRDVRAMLAHGSEEQREARVRGRPHLR